MTIKIENLEKSFPLLNNCSTWESNDSSYLIKTRIDEESYIFVNDHQFNEENIMPGTFLLEMLLESAKFTVGKVYNPEKEIYVEEINDFAIERALSVNKGKPMDLEIVPELFVSKDTSYTVYVKILSYRINNNGKVLGKRIIARAIITMTDKPLALEYFPGVKKGNFSYYDFSDNILDYYDFFHSSHGPRFQTITGRFAIADDGSMLLGEYDCKNMPESFIKNQQSRYISEPLGNDTTLQYGVMLAITEGLQGRLPVGGEKIQIFNNHPLSGNCYVYVEKIYMNESIMSCNIVSFNSQGEILMKAENFKLQRAPYSSYDGEVMNTLLEKYSCGKIMELHIEERSYAV